MTPSPAMEIDHVSSTSAALACSTCRKQKRKCDKGLPSCGLCRRIGRICDYTDDARPASSDIAALREEMTQLRSLLALGLAAKSAPTEHSNTSDPQSESETRAGTAALSNSASCGSTASPPQGLPSPDSMEVPCEMPATFPSTFFLDSASYGYRQMSFHPRTLQVPSGALSALGEPTAFRRIVEDYFSSVHVYFPIVSKIRLYQKLSDPRYEVGADTALLFLAMKLCNADLSSEPSAYVQLYHDVKALSTHVEMQNIYSLQLIQSLVLVCLYEMGHGIYPAAYMTIGHVARMGYAVGLHNTDAPQLLPPVTTWTEQEERRRVWWSIVILDRVVNVGHRAKPFATTEPGLEAFLPVEDQAWDRGHMLLAMPLAYSASTTADAGPFARTCQAAHFLGKVIQHINDRSHLSSEHCVAEALQLDRLGRSLAESITMTSRTESSLTANLGDYDHSEAMCFSGLLELYDSYTCTRRMATLGPESQLQMQRVSIDGLAEFTTKALHFSRRLREHMAHHDMQLVSPLVLDCLHQCAANHAWYVRESSDPEYAANLLEVKSLLQKLEARWKVAGDYVQMTEVWSHTHAST